MFKKTNYTLELIILVLMIIYFFAPKSWPYYANVTWLAIMIPTLILLLIKMIKGFLKK